MTLLVRHPATPAGAIHTVDAELSRTADGVIATFRVDRRRHAPRRSRRRGARAGRRSVENHLLRTVRRRARARPIASSISRPRRAGPPTISPATGPDRAMRPARVDIDIFERFQHVRRLLLRSHATFPIRRGSASARSSRRPTASSATGRSRSRRVSPIFTPRPPAPCCSTELTLNETRHRTAARRPRASRAARRQARRLARASRLGDARPHPQPRRAGRAG